MSNRSHNLPTPEGEQFEGSRFPGLSMLLGALALIGEHLDHFFDSAQSIGQPFVASLINGTHATAANTLDNRIPVEQQRSRFKLLAGHLF